MASGLTFYNVAKGVQSIVITLAVIIGGIWTVYTFSVLGTAEKAKLELFKQAAFEIDVNAKYETTGEKSFYILGIITITNKGNRNSLFSSKNSVLTVYKIDFDNRGGSTFREVAKMEYPAGSVIRTGTSHKHPFLLRVFEKGAYYINYAAPITDEDAKIYKESGGEDIQNVSWSGQTHLVIK